MRCVRCVVFFFFQAEDGIRDYKVTGVQTCALPILHRVRDGPRLPGRAELHPAGSQGHRPPHLLEGGQPGRPARGVRHRRRRRDLADEPHPPALDRKSTRLNSSYLVISYAVFCLKKKKNNTEGYKYYA